MKPLLQWILPVFLLLFYGLHHGIPKWRMRKKEPQALRSADPDSLAGQIAAYFSAAWTLPLYAVGTYVFFPYSYRLTAPMTYLEMVPLQIVGLMLMGIAGVLVGAAQYQMGIFSRLGVASDAQTDLIETGLFRFSRNPFFGGTILAFVGLWLVLPNAFTLLAAVLAYVLLQLQVRLEEADLLNLHGEKYTAYQSRVRRWV